MNNAISTPVVFFIFKRPDTTFRVFEKIREIKPSQLIIISDGPKNEEEKWLVDLTRDIVNRADWDCVVDRVYSETNMGCALRIISGLNYVFQNHEKAIILEDDCLPSSSFFSFCSELLNKYESEEKIMHISGCNLLGEVKIREDYFFSNYAFPPWGWATWKRAWSKYSIEIEEWNNKIEKYTKARLFSAKQFPYWNKAIERNIQNKDTWDHQWAFALWDNKGLSIIPKCNLISNIGFDIRGVHTRKESIYSDMKTNCISFPLNHPSIIINSKIDKKYVKLIECFIKSLNK